MTEPLPGRHGKMQLHCVATNQHDWQWHNNPQSTPRGYRMCSSCHAVDASEELALAATGAPRVDAYAVGYEDIPYSVVLKNPSSTVYPNWLELAAARMEHPERAWRMYAVVSVEDGNA